MTTIAQQIKNIGGGQGGEEGKDYQLLARTVVAGKSSSEAARGFNVS